MSTTNQSDLPEIPDEMTERIEWYLDDAMSAQERAAFEQELEVNAALRARMEAIATANEALAGRVRAHFEPPQESGLPARVGRTAAERMVTARRMPRMRIAWMAAAAVVALAVGGVWVLDAQRTRASAARGEQLAAYYEEQVGLGLTPQWVCKDDPTFRAYTAMRFGTTMSFVPPPEGLALVGWGYVRGPMRSESNGVLMATVEGTPVLVVVDRRGEAPRVATAAGSLVRVFRKDLEHVTLYEVTPLAEPRVLELIYEVR